MKFRKKPVVIEAVPNLPTLTPPPWLEAANVAGIVRPMPDGSIAPFLATEYTYNADMTELTLKLRTDVKFTDGAKFDAEAAKANLEHQLQGKGPNSGRVGSIDSVTASDASTLAFGRITSEFGLMIDAVSSVSSGFSIVNSLSYSLTIAFTECSAEIQWIVDFTFRPSGASPPLVEGS